jgi:regulator of replication initiation timing
MENKNSITVSFDLTKHQKMVEENKLLKKKTKNFKKKLEKNQTYIEELETKIDIYDNFNKYELEYKLKDIGRSITAKYVELETISEKLKELKHDIFCLRTANKNLHTNADDDIDDTDDTDSDDSKSDSESVHSECKEESK